MIGKKINQLATELAPESTDLTIIGDPTTGVSKKITLAQLGAIFSGAVSFYTNLASFPATGDINVIYCAKDTQKLYLWSGSAYVEVFPSQALLDTYQLRSEKGNANGYASLDSQGKVPITQLPSSIMEYKGTWNASTNTPTLANGTGDTGDVYICNVAGTVNFGAGPITFAVGDYVIYSGTIWQRSSGAVGTVTSVAASITGDSVTISGSPVTTSGTLAFAFAGTGAQYIKGDGTLATFPTTIDQAKNLITEVYNSTGATLTKGTVVYINGGQGNLPTVTKALASGDSTSAQTYGIVQSDITNMNNGYVVVAGRLADIDTSAFSVGTQLYLSSTTAGAYTSTKQYAPAHLVYVGIIVRSHPTQGIIEVKIQNGYELDELHNVAAQTPTNNDGLFWESATSLWKNKSIATVLGYTPANAATYVPYTGATTSLNLGTNNITARNYFADGDGSTSGSYFGFKQYTASFSGAQGYTSIYALEQNSLYIRFSQLNLSSKNVELSSALLGTTARQYLFPDKSGTFAMTSDLTGGTVTSVAALTIGTSGTDLSSTVANGTTTPVITLNVPTASATNRGALSSTDWTTFNNKQNALTNPVTGTGTTNYLPKFTGTSAIGNSQVYDDGTNVGIGTTSANTLLSLVGNHAGGQSILKIQSSTAYSSSGLSSIGFNDSDGSRKAIIYTNTNGLQLETGTATSIIFNPNGTTALTLANGGAATFSSSVTTSGGGFIANMSTTNTPALTINRSSTSYNGIIKFQNGASDTWILGNRNTSDETFRLYNYNVGADVLIFANTGAATFSSSVTAATESNFTGTSVNSRILVTASGVANTVLGFNNSGSTATGVSNNTGYVGVLQGYPLAFITESVERMRITSGGNVGIGTTTIDARLDVYADSGNNIYLSTVSKSSVNIAAQKKGVGYTTLDIEAQEIRMFTATTERMRITSGGNLLVGTTSDNGIKFQVSGDTYATGYVYFKNQASTNNFAWYGSTNILLYNSAVGNIASIDATTGIYTPTSDKNKKKDFENSTIGLNAILGLKPTLYRMKSENGTEKHLGFIAQEVKEFIPQAYVENDNFIGLSEMPIVAALTKAVQELKQELDTLKNK